MKRLFLAVLCTMFSVAAFAQAKKPTIMVVPADQWCLENGYYDEVNEDGIIKQVVNYEKALYDRSLNQVIIAMGNEMVDRNFPLVDLNATIKDIALNAALDGDDVKMSRIDRILNQARADIMLEVRPSSIAANPVESREASPSSIVSLTSQRHPEKLPEVTGTSRGNTGFPAATRERPRASFFIALSPDSTTMTREQ